MHSFLPSKTESELPVCMKMAEGEELFPPSKNTKSAVWATRSCVAQW